MQLFKNYFSFNSEVLPQGKIVSIYHIEEKKYSTKQRPLSLTAPCVSNKVNIIIITIAAFL